MSETVSFTADLLDAYLAYGKLSLCGAPSEAKPWLLLLLGENVAAEILTETKNVFVFFLLQCFHEFHSCSCKVI